ncbi:MAG: MFS transporter [Chlamydiales bacterium]|nr:MFS transporter [Chlamydiales bacterium]
MTATRSNYRWVITGLIFFITLVNYIDRSAISFVIEPLKTEFGFTDTQFGMILSAFGLGYVLLTALGGWLVDVWGARIVWPLAAITWSLCVAFLGFASGFWSFIAIRFMLGLTEGPHFPAMASSIGNWLTPNERARALSFGLVAIPLSSCVGAPIISYLVATFEWRMMFWIVSLVGIVWAGVWYYFYTDSPQDSPRVNAQEKEYIKSNQVQTQTKSSSVIDWRFMLLHPALIANNVAYFAFGYMLFFATLWLPGYFLHEHNLNLKSVGWYLTIPWLVGAVFLKFGGILSDWLYKKTGSGRIAYAHLIWISQLISGCFFVMLSLTSSLTMATILLSFGLGFGLMSQPSFFSVNIAIAKERAGTSQGINSSCLSLGGIIAPILTGWLIDKTGTYKAAFLLLAATMLIAVVTVILLHHPDRAWSPKAKKRLSPA